MTLSRARRPAGFTLVELMLASLIFSMVVAGLAAIYSTAYHQSGRIITDSRLKSTAAIALRQVTQEVVSATRFDEPAPGGSGSVLRGCSNMATDGTQITAAQPVTSFGFCVQNNTNGACTLPDSPPPCLVYYRWPNVCAAPALNGGNCGSTVSGVTPFVLASHLEVSADPSMPQYFTRNTGQKSWGTSVRVAFSVSRDATQSMPKAIYEVDTIVSGQFDGRL
ncbi:MAG: type II secretion system protein [Elusimicrobia bacterium]|nr:type II secretion system protein [Elusimicrobiota bacterium]